MKRLGLSVLLASMIATPAFSDEKVNDEKKHPSKIQHTHTIPHIVNPAERDLEDFEYEEDAGYDDPTDEENTGPSGSPDDPFAERYMPLNNGLKRPHKNCEPYPHSLEYVSRGPQTTIDGKRFMYDCEIKSQKRNTNLLYFELACQHGEAVAWTEFRNMARDEKQFSESMGYTKALEKPLGMEDLTDNDAIVLGYRDAYQAFEDVWRVCEYKEGGPSELIQYRDGQPVSVEELRSPKPN